MSTWHTPSTTEGDHTRSRWDGDAEDVEDVEDAEAARLEEAGAPQRGEEDGETQEKAREQEWVLVKVAAAVCRTMEDRRMSALRTKLGTAGMGTAADMTIGRMESWCGKGKPLERRPQ